MRGGGGRGALFASPMRRRVMVNWALVGTPFKRVLFICEYYARFRTASDDQAYFLNSSNFFQPGNVLFSQSTLRDIVGSPKKPSPIAKVTAFVNMYDVTNSDNPKMGMITAASRIR